MGGFFVKKILSKSKEYKKINLKEKLYTMKKVGQILLLISGIALIALGLWSLITALIGLVGVVGGAASGGDEGTALLITGVVLLIVGGLSFLFSLLAGVAGIKAFTKGDEKAIRKAFIWGIIILVLNIAGLIGASFSISLVLSLVVDVAYIVGAFMAKLAK